MSTCRNCGTSGDRGDRFCRRCGNPIAGGDVAAMTEEISREGTHRRATHPTATATIERPAARAVELEPAHRVGEARDVVVVAPRDRFPWGDSLALIGAIAVIISAILDWGGPFRSTLPRDISAKWLLEPGTQAGGPSLGLAVLFAGTLGALAALMSMAAPGFTFLRRGVGLISLMVPLAFGFRTVQLVEGGLSAVPDAIGVGMLVAGGGSLVQLAAGKRRR
jgi:hypothetical protein